MDLKQDSRTYTGFMWFKGRTVTRSGMISTIEERLTIGVTVTQLS